jgi:predicted phage gp36 major capsid-like protein
MMLEKLSRSLIVGSIMTLAACGTARVIHRDQVGGVLELQGDRGKAMEQANQEMAAHCGPNNFTVVQEGEEAIGTDTFTREDQATDSKTSKSGRRSATDSTTTAQQSTRTATAWRVHYQCGGAAVGAGGPPPGAPPPPPPPGAAPPPPGN